LKTQANIITHLEPLELHDEIHTESHE